MKFYTYHSINWGRLNKIRYIPTLPVNQWFIYSFNPNKNNHLKLQSEQSYRNTVKQYTLSTVCSTASAVHGSLPLRISVPELSLYSHLPQLVLVHVHGSAVGRHAPSYKELFIGWEVWLDPAWLTRAPRPRVTCMNKIVAGAHELFWCQNTSVYFNIE